MQELESGQPSDARRRFLSTSGKAALAAPAVALLLAAGSKGANAQAVPYTVRTPILDDNLS